MEHDLLDEVVLLDEAGEPARFSHILTFLYEGERYIALSPWRRKPPKRRRRWCCSMWCRRGRRKPT